MENQTNNFEKDRSSEQIEVVDKFTPQKMLERLTEAGETEAIEAYGRVLSFAELAKEAGGQALLVGGSVRDILLDRPVETVKDFDLEVYGLPAEQVETLASQLGKVDAVGRSFGVLKMMMESGLDVDIALPRTDSKAGEGHRGFEITTDPYMSIEEAARRRDFTINAMLADPLTGEVYDYYGGRADLAQKQLRIVDEERFQDDPLRVLRAVQFSGRFNFDVEPASFDLMRSMVDQLPELPKERIGQEIQKLLLGSERPSKGLELGLRLEVWQQLFPDLAALVDVEQDPIWHPEGDVWNHTMMVVDKMADLTRDADLEKSERYVLMLAGLCHDFGKVNTTETQADGRIISYGHAEAGVDVIDAFLQGVAIDHDSIAQIKKLVEFHMAPAQLFAEEEKGVSVKDGTIRRLALKLYPATLEQLAVLSEADKLGRDGEDSADQHGVGAWLIARARALNIESAPPENLVTGKDLINLGFGPGVDFGRIIDLANHLRDEQEASTQEILDLLAQFDNTSAAINQLENILNQAS